MFITKTALPRRTFLRGMGVTLGLPLLDAMVPAASALANTAAKPVRRLGFVYIPNGAVMTHWQPEGNGKLKELSPTLSPLAPFQDQVIVPIGLSQKQAEALGDGNGEHSRAGTVFLSGVHPKETEGADVRNGITADQNRRAAHRWRHAAALARVGDGADLPHRQLRQRLFLRLHQQHLVADGDHPEPARDEPAHRLPADVRRRRHARGAAGADAGGPQHPRLGDRRHRAPAEEARPGGPQQRQRVSGLRP